MSREVRCQKSRRCKGEKNPKESVILVRLYVVSNCFFSRIRCKGKVGELAKTSHNMITVIVELFSEAILKGCRAALSSPGSKIGVRWKTQIRRDAATSQCSRRTRSHANQRVALGCGAIGQVSSLRWLRLIFCVGASSPVLVCVAKTASSDGRMRTLDAGRWTLDVVSLRRNYSDKPH